MQTIIIMFMSLTLKNFGQTNGILLVEPWKVLMWTSTLIQMLPFELASVSREDLSLLMNLPDVLRIRSRCRQWLIPLTVLLPNSNGYPNKVILNRKVKSRTLPITTSVTLFPILLKTAVTKKSLRKIPTTLNITILLKPRSSTKKIIKYTRKLR